MKIAFVSVRGIPNNYGGFEQFAEYISVGLVRRGHDVTVYSPHYHPYKKNEYKGVHIKHIYSPEKWIGNSFGSFFYDYASLKDALENEAFDIIYVAGYTSIIPAYIRFNVKKLAGPVIVTNMDGLEYKRLKFKKVIRRFLFWEERKAVEYSKFLIADNMGIHDYYKEQYGRESKYLAYGADVPEIFDENFLKAYGLTVNGYYLLIARLEPENNIEIAIKGYLSSKECGKRPLVIIGKVNTPFGKILLKKYGNNSSVRFIGGLYDIDILNSIRHYSYAYFHGHCVGGTNPSLLEAMAAGCFILSHCNIFNKSVLGDNAIYYKNEKEVTEVLNHIDILNNKYSNGFIQRNRLFIKNQYSWSKLIDEHEQYFMTLLTKRENK